VVNDERWDFMPIREKSERRLNYLRLIAHCTVWCMLLVLLACGVPRFEAVFADFGIPLPNLTILVIEASHLALAVIASTVLLLVADWFVMARFARRGDVVSVRAWSLLMIATPVVMLALTLGGLILPMLTITQRLSG
jgi:type II secretory pathway component PulF